jgi:aspartate dehydrogenase
VTSDPVRVGLIGHGSIGSVVAQALYDGAVGGCRLAGVFTRTSRSAGRFVASISELVACSDLVIEAAGQEALQRFGPVVRGSGRDLLVISVGALADDELLDRLRQPTGRLLISSGAIGGLDTLRAAQLLAPLDSVALTSTKPPQVLQPWIEEPLRAALQSGREARVVFSGSAREAVRRFPQSVNVAATLSLATVGFDRTSVTVIGDPGVEHVEHKVHASGSAGHYEFLFYNRPSEENARSSAITPYAVLRALQDLRSSLLIGI